MSARGKLLVQLAKSALQKNTNELDENDTEDSVTMVSKLTENDLGNNTNKNFPNISILENGIHNSKIKIISDIAINELEAPKPYTILCTCQNSEENLEIADTNFQDIDVNLESNNNDLDQFKPNNDIEVLYTNFPNENSNILHWDQSTEESVSKDKSTKHTGKENTTPIVNIIEPDCLKYGAECINQSKNDFKKSPALKKGEELGFTKENIYNSKFLIKNKYKITICKFCDADIISKHFARHLERIHFMEREVTEMLQLKKGSVERKNIIALLRNNGNLETALNGNIIPKKRELNRNASEDDYAICIHCNAFFKRHCLSRHTKTCFASQFKKKEETNSRPLNQSIIYLACRKKYGAILNKLSVTKQIFSKMHGDIITKTAINDILIAHLGEDLLKKNTTKRSTYHISNKLRECGRFLLEIRKLGKYTDILSTLKPMHFDNGIEATKNISRYQIDSKAFGAASLALHFGTTLKRLSDLATKMILRNKIPNFIGDFETTLVELKRFRKLVDTQWTMELGSLALKNLNEKAAMKPQLLPLTEDIIKLKTFVEEKSKNAYELLKTTKTKEHYKTLVETTLILTILHNRKRVGDIQYLQQDSYRQQIRHDSNVTRQSELTLSLSENERILTQHYLRIVAIGKGSRAVTLLIPKNFQKYFSMIDDIRHNTPSWFSLDSTYFFIYPHSNRWIDGCSVIRRYAKQCGARNPELLTSSRLRKHIATVTQVLNLKRNEIDQLAKFMGHTTRTHEQFYKLPQDVYQVAKVSKILQLMEKGNVDQFKNRSLEEIDIDMENVLEEENISEHNNKHLKETSKSTRTYEEQSKILGNISTDISDVDQSSVASTSSKPLKAKRHFV